MSSYDIKATSQWLEQRPLVKSDQRKASCKIFRNFWGEKMINIMSNALGSRPIIWLTYRPAWASHHLWNTVKHTYKHTTSTWNWHQQSNKVINYKMLICTYPSWVHRPPRGTFHSILHPSPGKIVFAHFSSYPQISSASVAGSWHQSQSFRPPWLPRSQDVPHGPTLEDRPLKRTLSDAQRLGTSTTLWAMRKRWTLDDYRRLLHECHWLCRGGRHDHQTATDAGWY